MTQLVEPVKSEPAGKGQRRFSRFDTERALLALAYANGQSRLAAKSLESQGLQVNESTLRNWRDNRHAELYREIQQEVLPKIRDRAAELHMEAAERTMEVESEALARLRGKLSDIPARDLPGAVRNLGTTTGIHRDKARDLRGETSAPPVRTKDLKEVLAALAGKGITPEVVDAEVVEEKPKEIAA